ncbi:hypothetical protein AQUCO_03100015v1 [Aquilegia coerulea]|uniref:Uncharacterized protein n=1 Tax=Aquilegia coerulea TaxID=218851 RepID=A0A2G5D0C4_AQUCA|nr:hypothetical protein AQUCO_03100015v1 [Aquilegia coerulea]
MGRVIVSQLSPSTILIGLLLQLFIIILLNLHTDVYKAKNQLYTHSLFLQADFCVGKFFTNRNTTSELARSS